MLITESQMGFMNSRYGMNAINLLDNMHYLSEAESVYSPALVPVIENKNIGAHLIRLEDMISFAESNGIEDLGYALTCVCESSEVDPSTIVFTVQEENLIADDDLASLTSAIMNEGVGVVAKPLNENNPMGILTDFAVNYLLETGDDSALYMLCEDFTDLAIEYVVAVNEASSSNTQRLKSLQAQLGEADPKMQAAFEKDLSKYGTLSNKQAEEIISTWSNRLGSKNTKKPTNNTGSTLTPEQQALKARLKAKFKPDTTSPINTEELSKANNAPTKTKVSLDKDAAYAAAQRQRHKNAEDYRNTVPGPTGASAGSGVPDTPEKAETFLDKIKSYANKGRDAIAAVIAKINGWIRNIEADHTKTGVWNTIVGRLKQALNWLTTKLHNTIASDNRDKI